MADAAPLIDWFTGARWLGYVATFALIGAATFQLLLLARLVRYHPAAGKDLLRRGRHVAIMGSALLLIAALLKLRAQISTLVDPGEAVPMEMVKALVSGSGWGHGWLWQVGVAGIGLLLILLVRGTLVIPLVAVAVASVAPLTGHATENPWGMTAGLILHGVHQLGGGVWLGTLGLIVLLGYGATGTLESDERHQLIARLVNAYSPMALAGVGTAILAGLIMAYGYVGTIPALWTTDYGRVLLVKTGCLAVTAGIGAYNWRRVRPALGTSAASQRLLRSATLELLIGTLLLVATAVLVALPAPGMGN